MKRQKHESQRSPETGRYEPLASPEANGDAGKAAEKVAKKVGVSQATIERYKVIEERGTPEQIETEKVERNRIRQEKAVEKKERRDS